MAGTREDVSEALGRAVDIAGPEVLQQPKRLRALLADLVGQPASDHRTEIEAVVVAAGELAGDRRRGAADVHAALVRRGIADSTARWALSVLHEHGVGTGDTPSAPAAASGGSRRWLWIPAACLVVIVPLAVLLLRPGPNPDPHDENGGGSSTTPVSTTTTAPPAEVTGFRVEFEPAAEGAFRVTRMWEISDGRVTGTVSLTGAGTGPALHRELIPAEAFTDPVLTPEPDNEAGEVVGFNLDLAEGEDFSFTFEAGLAVPEPDEAEVQSWVDGWQERVDDLRPLDEVPPADASITPLA